MTLQERFDPRRNNFDLLRLLLAAVVALSHGLVIRTGEQPHWGTATLGDFAVDGFFILSGFLVTRSWISLSNFWRYSWHRILRIMPAFWACLLILTVIVAPIASLIERRPLSDLLTAPNSAPKFALANSLLLITQYDIAAVFSDNPTPLVVDGSLWTLALEALCYGVLAGLGLLGVLTRRRIVVAILAVVAWGLLIVQSAGVDVLVGDQTIRMLFLFLLGATAQLYAHRVVLSTGLAVVSAVVFVAAAAMLEDYRAIGAVPLAYLLFWLAAGLPRSIRLPLDLSYGVYIYHWPLQQLLMLTVLARLPVSLFVAAAVLLVVPVAALSWYAVERPALRRKNIALPRWLPGNAGRSTAGAAPGRAPEHVTVSAPRAADPN